MALADSRKLATPRYDAALESRPYRRLAAKIEAQRAKRAEFIVGGGASDYAQYRESVGYDAAMQDVLKLCEEIESEENQ